MSARVSIHTTLVIDHSEIRASYNLPYEVADLIISPVQVTDEPMGIGDLLAGSAELEQRYQVRDTAIKTLAMQLAMHLIKQLESRDTLNGYPVASKR